MFSHDTVPIVQNLGLTEEQRGILMKLSNDKTFDNILSILVNPLTISYIGVLKPATSAHMHTEEPKRPWGAPGW